jgi:trimethylamine--corrinoid protein Co-methyltransferase
MGHEKTLTSLVPALAGVSVIYGAGMIDNGMSMSYDELIIDCEFIRMNRKVVDGLKVDEETLATEIIKKVGPVGNYLSQRHTLKHVRGMSRADLIDRRSRAGWEKLGATTMEERAHERALRHFAEYKSPVVLDEAVAAKIRKIIADAEAEADKDI